MNREELSKKLGLNIRRFRTQKSMSQEMLALDAGINPAYLGRLERGEKCPNVDTLFKISDALGISVSELLAFEKNSAEEAYVTKNRLEESLQKLPPSKQRQIAEIVETLINAILEK